MRIEWSIEWRPDVRAFQSHVEGRHWGDGRGTAALTVLLPDDGQGLEDPGRVQEIGLAQVSHVFGALVDPDYEGPARPRAARQPVQPVPLEEVMR